MSSLPSTTNVGQQMGNMFTCVAALPLTAAIALQATPVQMGSLKAAQFAPFLLIGLIAGVWVDRQRRRPGRMPTVQETI